MPRAAAPPCSRKKHIESRDTDTVVPQPMRRTRVEERIPVEYSAKPPWKKLRLAEEIPSDAYDSDYCHQVLPISCYDNRANTWDLPRRRPQGKEHLDGPGRNTPSGRYCRWNAPGSSDATSSSTLSRQADYSFTSSDDDIRYSNKVACHADGISFTTDKYLPRFTDRDSDGLATNGYVGSDGRDGYNRFNTTCTSLDTYRRESKSDVGCVGSRSAIHGDPSKFTDQFFASGEDDDDHTVETYPQSLCQSNVEGESISNDQSWYPQSSQETNSFIARNSENSPSGKKSELSYSNTNPCWVTEEGRGRDIVCATQPVNVTTATVSYNSSTSNTQLWLPSVDCGNGAPESNARSQASVPYGLVLSPFASYNVSAFGGYIPCNSIRYPQFFTSCAPNCYGVANNLDPQNMLPCVSGVSGVNSQTMNQVPCGTFYNATAQATNLPVKEQNADSAVETDENSQLTTQQGSSCTAANEHSASVFSNIQSDGDICNDSSIRTLATLHHPGQVMTCGTSDICGTVGKSPQQGHVGYWNQQNLFVNDESASSNVFWCSENAPVCSRNSDTFSAKLGQNMHSFSGMAGSNGHAQQCADGLKHPNNLTGFNAVVAQDTHVFYGSEKQGDNLQDGVGYFDQTKLPVIDHAKNLVAWKSGSNKVCPNGTELTPQEDEEALAQSTAVATAADSTFVKSTGETSACIKQDTGTTAEECGGDSTSGCALTSGDSQKTSSTNGAEPESPSAEAAPWQIGPQACPSGYATALKSLTLHTALQGLHTRRRKLKWPLPIPLLVKPRDTSVSFHNVDYALLSQCVYLAAQEEVHAQTLDEKGWLRIFVATPRAAHFLVQTETLAGVLVKCSVVSSYTNSIGYIHSVPRRYTDTAIFEMLKDEGVICAQRQSGFMRYRKGAIGDVATGTVMLTFLPDRRLPTTVTVGLLTFEVLRRLSLPTQCFKCQRFGHYAEQCKLPIACRLCAGVHLHSECTKKDQPRCVNCGEPHPSTYWKCPVRLARASSDPRNSWIETVFKV